MSSGGGSKTVESSSSTQIPAWMSQAGQELYQAQKGVASRPYPTYEGPRIAPFSPDTLASQDVTRQNVGAWQPFQNAGAAYTAAGADQVTGQDISRYMNPYTQNVVDTTRNELYRQNERDRNSLHANMAQRGSYLNEDRREVIDQLSREGRDRVLAETTAALNLQGFQNALGQANTDKGRQMQAGGMFSQYAPQVQQLGYQDAAALGGIGAQQENLTQQNLSLGYEDFLRQFYYPQEQLNFAGSLLQGVPYSSYQTQQRPQGTRNKAAGALGGAATGAGIGTAISPGWGTAIGAVGGGIAGAFSDRRLKKNVKRIGKSPGGANVYSFNYKGEPKKSPKHVGYMAQDLKKKQPDAVGKHGKYMTVDYEVVE